MKAAVLRAVGEPLSIEDVEIDGPNADEVRIRVRASGLCHSDYHSMTGDIPTPMPTVLGHEAAGIVEAVGSDVSEFKPGDAVVSCLSMYCGHCSDCLSGHNHICGYRPVRPEGTGAARLSRDGEQIHQFCELGAFAEEMLVHRNAVTKLPEGMPLDRAALLGCAVLTGVGAATECAEIKAGSTVAVIGCGGVGLNVIQGAFLAGAGRVVAVDINPAKLELAKAFGATDCVAGGEDAHKAVLELTGGGVDYAFEVIGLPATQKQGLKMLRRRGTLVLVGIAPASATVDFSPLAIIAREYRIVGSFMGSVPFKTAIPNYAQLYLDGRLQLDPLVSQRIRLGDVNRGYEQMVAGEVARSVIMFDA